MTRDEAVQIVEETLNSESRSTTLAADHALAALIVDSLLEPGYGSVTITDTERET